MADPRTTDGLPVEIVQLISLHNSASMDLAEATTPEATHRAVEVLKDIRARLVAAILRFARPTLPAVGHIMLGVNRTMPEPEALRLTAQDIGSGHD
jgi:hypothetical protein